jgi:arylformamidase
MISSYLQGNSPEWIDVSVPVFKGMVHWPGDPPVEVKQTLHLDRGDPATVSQLSLGSHTGTHVDAPNHFLLGREGVDSVPIDAMVGITRVVELRGVQEVTPAQLEKLDINEGERILFKTSNSSRCWETNEFVPDFVSLSGESAEFLVRSRVRTVGVDYLSVGRGEAGPIVHRKLLEEVCVIEGLNLAKVNEGLYEMICLPIRVRGGDGAPARVILRKLTG